LLRKSIKPTALVFDFGGPVLLTPFEVREIGERALGLPPGTFTWAGPFDPDSDPDWQQFQQGRLTEREYWQKRAVEFGSLTGLAADVPTMMGYCYSGNEHEMIRPEVRGIIREAKAAGIKVGVLTNDLTAFHDQEWINRMTIMQEFDVIVDGKRDGVMKPDPAAYQLILDRLGICAKQAVFLDDQPINLAGATSIGMVAVHLDPTNPAAGFRELRSSLGL
jgi:putative hydrolase of the HAD superfamily